MDALERWQSSVHTYATPHLRLRQIAAIVSSLRPSTVADVGCATGYLRELLQPDVVYVGVDFVAPDDPSFEFIRCDLNREPLPERVADADVVVCSGVLEYIADLPPFLSNLRGRRAVGQRCVLSYFNMNHISRAVTLVRGETLPHHPDWRGFHSPRELQSMLRGSGFEITTRTVTSHGWRGSPGVAATTRDMRAASDHRPWSRWLGHQIIYVVEAV